MLRPGVVVLASAAILLAGCSGASDDAAPRATTTAPARSVLSPYFGAPVKATRTGPDFGQAPSWTHDGEVLSGQLDAAGINQVYRSHLDGSNERCLTCTTVAGPSGFPQERPQGDWILFESYGQQPVHTGGPGFGGYGGDLYVMRADGSAPHRLTTTSDPDDGKPYTKDHGVPYDNFHAYWSPNGKEVAWTHTEAHPLADGGQAWTMLIGQFSVVDGVAALHDVRVVGRPYGAYETQPWAPDGSGFLFSAAGGRQSPYQASPPGWGHMQLYYLRIHGPGASPDHPRVTLISDDTPAYQEQAVFTPDMRTVVMMSNRVAPSESWANEVVAAAQRTKFDADDTGSTQTLQFLSDFIGPGGFQSDLFAVDVGTKAIRRLTHDGGIIAEFNWDAEHARLIYSPHLDGTRVLRFEGVSTEVGSYADVPGLEGEPVAMDRVGDQAQPIRDLGPTDDESVPVTPPKDPAPAFPHATEKSDRATIPGVTATYLPVWLEDLAALAEQSGVDIGQPPLLDVVADFGS